MPTDMKRPLKRVGENFDAWRQRRRGALPQPPASDGAATPNAALIANAAPLMLLAGAPGAFVWTALD
jgi:hypothetical protein